MGPRSWTTVAAAILAFRPVFVAAYANSSFSEVDMLRAQLALMDDRPDGCPPWLVFLNTSNSVFSG